MHFATKKYFFDRSFRAPEKGRRKPTGSRCRKLFPSVLRRPVSDLRLSLVYGLWFIVFMVFYGPHLTYVKVSIQERYYIHFLVACTRLYKLLCWLVGTSVHPSVGRCWLRARDLCRSALLDFTLIFENKI